MNFRLPIVLPGNRECSAPVIIKRLGMSSYLGKRRRTGNYGPARKRFKTTRYGSYGGGRSRYQPSRYASNYGGYGVTRRWVQPSLMNHNVFKYRRSFAGATIAFSSGAETKGAFSFSLSQVAGYAEITAMYDYYRITKVKISYFPDQTDLISTGNLNSTDHVPLITAVDTANATAPATLDALREYNNHKVRSIIRPFKETFAVRFTDSVNSERQGWISTANATALHYGYKYAAPATNASTTGFTANVNFTVYIEAKDPK